VIRRLLLALVAVIAVGLVVFFTRGAAMADRSMNTLLASGPFTAPPAADSLLRTIDVVDLHADALLWPRDLLERHDHGHVDLPRLQDGHVALQVFSVVTKTPRGINYERNSADTDNITILAIAERYPFRAWFDLSERARWQGKRLKDAVARSAARGDSALRLIRSREDLAALLAARRAGKGVVGALLATEGLHPLEGRLDNLDTLAADGFRMFGVRSAGRSWHGWIR
jgi:membrane dipeptidase